MSKFKNRSERNKDTKTVAMILMKGKELVVSRPEGMSQQSYKVLREHQNKLMKKIFAKSPNPKISQLLPLRLGYNYHPSK